MHLFSIHPPTSHFASMLWQTNTAFLRAKTGSIPRIPKKGIHAGACCFKWLFILGEQQQNEQKKPLLLSRGTNHRSPTLQKSYWEAEQALHTDSTMAKMVVLVRSQSFHEMINLRVEINGGNLPIRTWEANIIARYIFLSGTARFLQELRSWRRM